MKLHRYLLLLSGVAITGLAACTIQMPAIPTPSAATDLPSALTSPLPTSVSTASSVSNPTAEANLPQRMMAFHSDKQQRIYQIYTTILGDSSEVKQLTSDIDRTIEPAWSPDGKHIVYASARQNRDGLDIWLMNGDGTEQTRLTDRSGYALSPTFSRDGTKVLFYTTWDGKFQLYEIELASKAVTRVSVNTSYNDYMPDISPDGAMIAFSSDRSGREEIWVMDVDDSSARQLTNAPVRNWRPRWSPDGTRILYQHVSQNYWELRLMNADGTQDAAPILLPYLDGGLQITEIQDHHWMDNHSFLFAGRSPQGYGIYYYDLTTQELRVVLDLPNSDEMWPMLRPLL